MKDDSARDKAMEKLVATRLRAGLRPSGGGCPDAGFVAAYVERTLAARERQNCETHLAACMGCQALVAELVRLSEDDEPVGARAVAVAPSRAAASRFRWAWAGGSALAATLVVVVWFSGELRKPSLRPIGIQSQSLDRTAGKASAPHPAPKEEKQIASAPAKSQEPSNANRREMKPLDTEADLKAAAENTRVLEARRAADNGQASALAKDDLALQSRTAPVTPPAASAAHALLPAPRPSPMAMPSERARLAMNKPGEGSGSGAGQGVAAGTAGGVAGSVGGTPQPAGESRDARPAAPTPPQNQAQDYEAVKEAANATAGSTEPMPKKAKAKKEADLVAPADADLRDQAGANKQKAQTVEVTAAAQALEVQAQSVVPAWRVGRRGLIQEVDSNGQRRKRNSGVKKDLNEISFSSPNVGWVVGQAGTILRTTDGGTTWNLVSSPTTEDLLHVVVLSDQAASVVSRTGLSFATSDGGRTWTGARP